MKSRTTLEFWKRYHRLPEAIQRLADRCYETWLENPRHPSIRFKKLEGHDTLYSARVGADYRALAHFDGGTAVWIWIGSHADYDKITGR